MRGTEIEGKTERGRQREENEIVEDREWMTERGEDGEWMTERGKR